MQFSEVTKGNQNDVRNTLQMFISITDHLLDQGIDQWNYDYPDLITLERDAAEGHNYVIRQGDLVAASIVLNAIQDEQYQNINWQYKSDNVLVIHRLGVHPDFQGNGLGKKMCSFAESFARENNFDTIRLDAYSDNVISNKMYMSLGYTQADGLCYFRNKSIPFFCFEKRIKL